MHTSLSNLHVPHPVAVSEDDHYLKTELYALIQHDPAIFQFLQDGSLDGIWYWDLTDPAVEWMSPRFWQVFGYDPVSKPHLAEAWQDMIHPQDLEVALANFQKHAADPSHPYDQIVRYRHHDGSMVWVRCRGIVIRDAEGTPIRMLGAHSDVTDLKEAEEKLRDQTEQLQLLNEELNQFAYAASHDLRSPINTLNALLKRLQANHAHLLDAAGQQLLAHAVKTANRMQPLAQGILKFSRLTHADPTFVPVDSQQLVADLLEDLQADIDDVAAEVTVADLPTLHAEPDMLRQVFQNLIGNALKFHKPDEAPRINISATEQTDYWIFAVQDNGIGIAPEHQDAIFDLFKRLHIVGEHTGTGLGLALCKKIVVLHGGTLGVESAPSKGSTFSFTLPKDLPT